MLLKVCEKNGFSLWKHVKKDIAIVFDENDRQVFKGNAYQANQKFMDLTAK